ncbi:MAG: phosphatase [Gammaproteobacteria bacterium]|nr:phosphatase [Gammaproteobacteria bacterium]
MHRTKHAQEITNRFRELVEDAGDSLDSNHYDELSLLIEAGIDASLVDYMEMIAKKLENMAHDVKHSAEFFEED